MAKAKVVDFSKVMGGNEHDPGTSGREEVYVWRPPLESTLKANWDAASNVKGGKMGMGLVIQNDEGKFRAAKTSFISGQFDPTIAEAMAAVHAIGFCKELGIQRLSLEGDAKNVVSALNSREESWSRMGHIVGDAKKLLEGFHSWDVNLVGRDANFAAHLVATLAA